MGLTHRTERDVVISDALRYVASDMGDGRNGADIGGGSSSVRWWENYLVRYFVGTVVGAAVVLCLAHLAEQSSGILQSLSTRLIQIVKDGSTKGLVVIAAGGFAYCYIASSPMMILHASRARLVDETKQTFNRWFYILLTAMLVVLGVFYVGSLLFPTPRVVGLLPWLVLLAITSAQLSLILLAHSSRFGAIKEFYLKLGEARSAGSSDKQSEYIETYRHLREHSNAYAIIILELLLGFVLAQVPDVQWLAGILIIWLLPAAYCWFIASLLEFVFARSQIAEKEQ